MRIKYESLTAVTYYKVSSPPTNKADPVVNAVCLTRSLLVPQVCFSDEVCDLYRIG